MLTVLPALRSASSNELQQRNEEKKFQRTQNQIDWLNEFFMVHIFLGFTIIRFILFISMFLADYGILYYHTLCKNILQKVQVTF